MRRKYVEERYRPWFVFGGSNGYVDISDGDRDVLSGVPETMAQTIIDEHNRLIDVIGDTALAFDEADSGAFGAFWYREYSQ